MSTLSKLTGIHISPQHGVHVEPLKALGTLASVGLPGIGGGIAGALSHIPGLGNAAGAVGGALSHIPGVSQIGSALGHVPGISSVEHWLGGNGGKNALGLAQGVNAAMQGRKANQLQNRALGTAEGAYAERAPLRQAGIQAMLHPQVPSLQPLADPGNPYSKAPQAPGVSPMGY